jgi:aspartate ammonia-lyase
VPLRKRHSLSSAKRTLAENRSVVELVEEEGLMAPEQLREVLRPERMIASV